MLSPYPDFSEYQYRVQTELGRNREGGRISYLAQRLDCEEELVVIKQFRFVQTDANWQGFKAYEREIQFLKDLDHSRIPRYLDSFETSDGFCMVQEYKTAPTLSDRRTFKPIEIQKIALSVLEILVDLQSRLPPIFHRDIKPENILVDDEYQAYLIDFGLARIDRQEVAVSSMVAGTPGFMAPEELFNRPLTKGSDLYSLGATIICLITNTRSIDINNLLDDNYQLKFSHLVTGVNPLFIKWLEKMVAPNPRDRFPDAIAAQQKLVSIDIDNIPDLHPDPDLDPIYVNRIDSWTQQRVSINYDSRFSDIDIPDLKVGSINIENVYDTIQNIYDTNTVIDIKTISDLNSDLNLDPVDIARINADNPTKKSRELIYNCLWPFFLTFSIITIAWLLPRLNPLYEEPMTIAEEEASDRWRAERDRWRAERQEKEDAAKLKDAKQWFETIKPSCDTNVKQALHDVVHTSKEREIYAAACYVLGDEMELANEIFGRLQREDRDKAAQILGEVGGMANYQGDYKSAVMAIALRSYPNAAAMYQVGMSAYTMRDLPLAKQRLTKFLQIYQVQDEWTREAKITLKKIELDGVKSIKPKRP